MSSSDGLQVYHSPPPQTNLPEVVQYPSALPSEPTKAEFIAPPDRGPFGLRAWPFGLLLALITAVVIGGGVGGGLGAALAKCQRSEDSLEDSSNQLAASAETVTATVTETISDGVTATAASITRDATYTVREPSAVPTVALDCPSDSDPTEYTSEAFNVKFNWYCGVDLVGGDPAAEGGKVTDLTLVIAYTVSACMDACAGFNEQAVNFATGQSCRGVTFRSEMAEFVVGNGGNCWLKNGTKAEDKDMVSYARDSLVYAEIKD